MSTIIVKSYYSNKYYYILLNALSILAINCVAAGMLLKIIMIITFKFFLSDCFKESTVGNRLTLINDCPCPGHNITFECTVTGGGMTVWQGSSVFNCPNNNNEIMIILHHINFDSSVIVVCNDGAIIVENLRVDGNSYTSQLNIIYKEQFTGENVTFT